MWKSFVILVEILIFVWLIRSPFVQYLFGDIHDSVSNWMIEVSEIGEKKMLSSLEGAIYVGLPNLKGYQKRYFSEVLSSTESVNKFYKHYCIGGDINPNIQGAELRYVCTQMSQSDVLAVN
ncbi:hypothetical protein OE749_08730 [Aestuariibacter sp. AA17]|uniref:Uncharacterized protein n=1 Tax=Fluctibacter corallii TaxID=2984329 RepID=A0ABT3A838_9ALTE|nr:hypothetical protein [Aestuariibacter sp. AA17]MCV2884780.1 hypothetical protein [Aestuariibacter sp. AA17]